MSFQQYTPQNFSKKEEPHPPVVKRPTGVFIDSGSLCRCEAPYTTVYDVIRYPESWHPKRNLPLAPKELKRPLASFQSILKKKMLRKLKRQNLEKGQNFFFLVGKILSFLFVCALLPLHFLLVQIPKILYFQISPIFFTSLKNLFSIICYPIKNLVIKAKKIIMSVRNFYGYNQSNLRKGFFSLQRKVEKIPVVCSSIVAKAKKGLIAILSVCKKPFYFVKGNEFIKRFSLKIFFEKVQGCNKQLVRRIQIIIKNKITIVKDLNFSTFFLKKQFNFSVVHQFLKLILAARLPHMKNLFPIKVAINRKEKFINKLKKLFLIFSFSKGVRKLTNLWENIFSKTRNQLFQLSLLGFKSTLNMYLKHATKLFSEGINKGKFFFKQFVSFIKLNDRSAKKVRIQSEGKWSVFLKVSAKIDNIETFRNTGTWKSFFLTPFINLIIIGFKVFLLIARKIIMVIYNFFVRLYILILNFKNYNQVGLRKVENGIRYIKKKFLKPFGFIKHSASIIFYKFRKVLRIAFFWLRLCAAWNSALFQYSMDFVKQKSQKLAQKITNI
jgi:hypothetical protein